MSFFELILTFVIAVFILKPTDLEKMMKFAAKIYLYCKKLLEQFQFHLDDKVKLLELEKNQQRAQIADKEYQQQSHQDQT